MKDPEVIKRYNYRITEAVIKCGMTKQQIAEKMNVDYKMLCCNGTMMNSYNLAKFCKVTGSSADYILGLR